MRERTPRTGSKARAGWGLWRGFEPRWCTGDRRPLYLAWLLCVENCEVGEEEEEPPVPSGLGSTSVSLTGLTDFFAHRSTPRGGGSGGERAGGTPTRRSGRVDRRAEAGRQGCAARCVSRRETTQALVRRLVRRFRVEMGQQSAAPASRRRTVAEILARANELREAESRKRARKAADAKRKQEQAAKAARARRLDELAARKPEAWRSVHQFVDSRKQDGYDMAVRLLVDLRALAARDDDDQDFAAQLASLRKAHARKPTFIARLDKAGLRGEAR